MEYLITTLPIIIIFLGWILRLEKKLTEIQTNINWIVKNCDKCQQS